MGKQLILTQPQTPIVQPSPAQPTVVPDRTAPALVAPPSAPANGVRVGLTAGAEHPWRWWVPEEPNVSRWR